MQNGYLLEAQKEFVEAKVRISGRLAQTFNLRGKESRLFTPTYLKTV